MLELFEVFDNLLDGSLIVLLFRECQKFGGLGQPRRQGIETDDNLFELRAFLAESLGARRVLPDIRLLEFPLNLGQPFCLGVVVKDTSSTHRSAP